MKSASAIYHVFFVVFAVFSLVYGKDDYELEPGSAAMFRLSSSNLSNEKIDDYTSEVQSLLAHYTSWEILNHRTTIHRVNEQGGDYQCAKADCATLNGQYLNVDYVIYGTIQTVGKSISIAIQIADVSTGRVISDVTKFFVGKESKFIKKTLPEVAEQLASSVRAVRTNAAEQIEKGRSSVQQSVRKSLNSESFSDVRGYLSYNGPDDASSSIVTDGKMAFGYLMVGANMQPDDVLRYSYQLQSYLSLAGAHAMLYIDEMEMLMQARGGTLKSRNRKDAQQIGRLLGVDFMGYGRISKFGFFGKYFFIRTRIVDVETGKQIKKALKFYRGSEDVFLTEVIPDVAAQLGESFDNHKSNYSTRQ